MYTECPHCQTCFRIAEEHLKVAGGKVRCGSCQEIFDATQHLFKNLTDREPITDFQTKPAPVTPPLPPAAPETPAAVVPRPEIEDFDLSIHMPAESPTQNLDDVRQERAAAPDQHAFMESTIGNDRYNNLDEIGSIRIPGELDFSDSNLQFADEPQQPLEEVTPDTDNNDPSRRTSYENIESMKSAATDADRDSIKDFYIQVDAQLHDDSEQTEANDRSKLDKDIDELLAFTSKLDTGSKQAQNSTATPKPELSVLADDDVVSKGKLEDEYDLHTMADLEKESEAPANEYAPADELEPEDDPGEVTNAHSNNENHDGMQIANDLQAEHNKQDASHNIDEGMPRALRRSLDMLDQKPRRSLGMSLLLGLLIIILIAGLGLQTILFRNVELAHAFPRMIPILNKVCDRLPCRYSGKKDISQIKLLNRDVRSDPNQSHALLISATFIDEAPFDQPYPNLLITLYDLSGNVVASRRFTPREYLASMYNRFLLMESGTPVQITLAVLDPGKDAINFEFSFQ